MALSNTAVPKYYGLFRDAVIRGEIPINKEISLEMNRIDHLISSPEFYYDDKAIDGFIMFCEEELTLTDGSDLHLLDSFKLWAEQLLSWYYYSESSVYNPETRMYEQKVVLKRLTRKQYLIVARGAAKSLYESNIQNYFLNIDTTTTHQVTTAPTMKQADEVISPIRTAITRARGPLFKFLTYGSKNNAVNQRLLRPKLLSTKKGIENTITNSLLEIRPMSIDKLQGLRNKITTIDEWLSGDVREDVIGAVEQGASKIDDYVILAVSSEGTVRNGTGDEIKMELLSILNGEYYAPHVSIFYYRLDSIDEVADPAMWVKANPNIGKTVSYETYHQDVERAEKAPSARNDILAKRFCLPLEGFTYFFTYEETLPHRYKDTRGLICSLGADLSRGDDFCSFTFLFPFSTGAFRIRTRAFITQRTLDRLPPIMRIKYQQFIDEGSLLIHNGNVLEIQDVYNDIFEYINDQNLDVRSFGYDPYNAKVFVENFERDFGPYGIVKIPQGYKTESVPLGELKKLSEDRLLEFDEEIMAFAMGNAVIMTDTNGNKKLVKKAADMKVDCVASTMDAYISYRDNIELYW